MILMALSKAEQQSLAKKKVMELFDSAELKFRKNKSLAGRHVRAARRLAMKHNVRIPKELKRKFCKHCYSYLKPGINLRVRNQNGKVVYTCLECGKFMRFGY